MEDNQDQQTNGGIVSQSGDALAEAIKKAAKQKIKVFILANLPVILTVLGVIFVIGIIVLLVINAVNRGAAGKSPFSQSTQDQILTVSAASGDQTAKTQLAGSFYEKLAEIIDKIQAKIESRKDEYLAESADNLEVSIASLVSGNPDTSSIKSELEKFESALKAENNTAYNQEINEIKSTISELGGLLVVANNRNLIIAPRDREYIKRGQIDGRILQALIYLVTPYPDGAGFEKIRVHRIKSSYDTENRRFTNEWPQSGESEKLTSAHFDGQAMDISVVDSVQRRLYKKGILRKKTEKMNPIDIKIAWQSMEPGKRLEGLTINGSGNSFGKIAQNQGLLDLFSIIGENLGYDFSQYNINTGSMSSLAASMGLIVLKEELGIMINEREDNSTTEKFLKNTGRRLVADCLGLPESGLDGYNDEELALNIGREYIASRLALLPKSLVGKNSNEVISSIGKRKVEYIFNMRNSFDYWSPSQTNTFAIFLGQDAIEKALNINGGSFAPNNINDIKNNIGIEKFEKIFANPDSVDTLLGLPNSRSYMGDMIKGSISPAFVKNEVGQKIINEYINNFQNHAHINGFDQNGNPTIGGSTNKKDEAWDLPEGSMEGLINATVPAGLGIFYNVGLDELAKKLTDSNEERLVIKAWISQYKDRELSGLRYRKSETSGDVVIKTIEQVRSPNQEKVRQLEARIAQIEFRLDERDFSINQRRLTPQERKDLEEEKEDLKEQIKMEGANNLEEEDSWGIVSEEYFNEPLGLPIHGIRDIFIRDEGEFIFTFIGDNKLENIKEREIGYVDLDFTSGLRAKVNFANNQIAEAEKVKAELLIDKEATMMDPELTEEERIVELAEIQEEIDYYQEEIEIWEAELRLATSNMHENIERESMPLSENQTFETCAGITVKDSLENGELALTLQNIILEKGSSSLQESMDLPDGFLGDLLQRLIERNNRREDNRSSETGNDSLNEDGVFTFYAEISYLDSRDGSFKKILTNTGSLPVSPNTSADHPPTEPNRYGSLSIFSLPVSSSGYSQIPVSQIVQGNQYYLALNLTEEELPGFSFKNLSKISLFREKSGSIKSIHSIEGLSSNDNLKLILEENPIILIEKPQESPTENKGMGSFNIDDLNIAAVGAGHIEDQLGMPKGSFKGKDINELTAKIGSSEKLYVYFVKTRNARDLASNLPITESNQKIFRDAFSPVDNLFEIKKGTTFDLMSGVITPKQYATKVGDVYTKKKLAHNLSQSLDTGNYAGYDINQQDILDMMSGNFSAVALKIGAKKMDDGLQLPYGTLKAIIDNPSANCIVTDENTGQTQSCISSLLAANGQEKLAEYFNLYNQVSISGNLQENFGQMQIEVVLNNLNPNPKLPNKWFEGATLKEIAFQLPAKIDDRFNNQLVNLNPYNKQGEDLLLQKFGFNPNTYGLAGLKRTEFTENSEPYNILIKIDDALNISRGTTAKLFNETITVKQYKEAVKDSYVKRKTNELTYSIFPQEIKDFLIKYDISKDDIRTIKNTDTKEKVQRIIKNIENGRIYFANEAEKQENMKEIVGQAILENILDPQSTLPDGWFSGTSIDKIVINIARLTSPAALQNLVSYDQKTMERAKNTLIQRFGYDIEYYSLESLKKSIVDNGNAQKVDGLLRVQKGSTLEFFNEKITPSFYKEKVKKANEKYGPTSLVYEKLIAGDSDDAKRIQEIKNKYRLTDDDILGAYQNPSNVFNKVIWNSLPPKEMAILFGLGIIKEQNLSQIGLKGEYTQNFAQTQIEDLLGLDRGTFSPGSSIEEVLNRNGAKRFAAALRIGLNDKINKNSESEISRYINEKVFTDSSDYWGNQSNTARSVNIDIMLKIDSEIFAPTCGLSITKCLLTKKVTTTEYIEFVRKNLFKKLEINTLVGYLANNNTINAEDPESNRFIQYSNTYVGAISPLIDDINNINDPNVQIALIKGFKTVGGIDLDDKAGFRAGTLQKMIENPDRAGELLFAQGLRSASEKRFTGASELIIVMQYAMPWLSFSDTDYYGELELIDANERRACPFPPVQTTLRERKEFIKEKRTLCQNSIINNNIREAIRRNTRVVSENGTVIQEGIDVPQEDIALILNGDTRVLTAMGFAYLQTQINVRRAKDDKPIGLWPDGFKITYQEIKEALMPTYTARIKESVNAGLEFDKKWKEENGSLPQPIGTIPATGQQIENPFYREYVTQRQEYVKERQDKAPSNAKKNLQYKYMDAQANSIAIRNDWPLVPAGFSRIIADGSPQERLEAFLRYEALYIINDPDLRQNINNTCGGNDICNVASDYLLERFTSFASGGSYEEFKNSFDGPVFEDYITERLFKSADRYLAEKWNLDISLFGNISLSENLIHYANTYYEKGESGAEFKDDKFNSLGRTVILNTVGKQFDERLNLPTGSFQKMYRIYDAYQKYQAAKSALAVKQTAAAINAAKFLTTGGRFSDFIKESVELTQANTSYVAAKANLKATAITVIVEIGLQVFSEELIKLDDRINAPPGTSASFISMVTSIAVYGIVGNPGLYSAYGIGAGIAIAIFLYTFLFGFSKIEVQMTCPGYYPPGASKTDLPWCKEQEIYYHYWAQIKVRQLIQAMIDIGDKKAGGKNLIPTVIGTFRQEDVDYFKGENCEEGDKVCKQKQSNKICNPLTEICGMRGIHQSDYMKSFIHINY
uniref:Uncharacterized protein n=1 Tax=candidate division CPR3 bacterium TaxID=2268181 RepID=A0A7C4M296_UNCC3